jgi:hypothetical protein
MRRTARLLALVAFMTLGAGAVSAPAAAFAQSGEALQAERARLRGQLDKVNAEIDGLKRAGGGVRDDYRLRARLADAESLARRLMEIEARLGIRVDAAAKTQPPPTAAPTDGPADLDAKADILADQSRRVRAQADALARRAADARGRQELRKRAADLDRDPFAPMEGSKRRIASGSGAAFSSNSNNGRNNIGTADMPTGAGAGPTGGTTTGTSLTPQTTPPSTNINGTEKASTPLSVQLRDLLDTAALSDVRRLEAGGAGTASPQALERAAAALRARADWLDGQSRSMRARAHTK